MAKNKNSWYASAKSDFLASRTFTNATNATKIKNVANVANVNEAIPKKLASVLDTFREVFDDEASGNTTSDDGPKLISVTQCLLNVPHASGDSGSSENSGTVDTDFGW